MAITPAVAKHRTGSRARIRVIGILAAASAVAIALNAVVAAIAAPAGAPSGYGPLTLPAYGLFSVIGVVVGWVGWTLVSRRARDPRRMLTILVPTLTLASLIPDVLLLVLGFIPGTTAAAAIALMAMHLVVVGVAVPAFVLASRVPGRTAA